MRALVAAALLACVSFAAVAHADDDGARRAKALYQSGLAHFNVGEYKEALDSFKQAYLAKQDPVFLFNMGQCYRMLGDPAGAVREYRAYLRESPNARNREAVEKFIDDAEAEIKRRQAEAPPTGISPPSNVAPTTTTAPATDNVVEKAPEAATPVYKKWWLWTIIAVVVAGGAATAIALALVPNDAAFPTTSGGSYTPRF